MNPWEKYAAQPVQPPWEKYAAQQAPPAAPAAAPQEQGWGGWAVDAGDDLLSSALSGLLSGGAYAAGAPVDILNSVRMLNNLPPGEQGFGPLSQQPVGGHDWIMDALGLPNAAIDAVAGTELGGVDYQPEGMPGRFVKRIGEEVGAAALPVGAAASKAQRVGETGLEGLSALERYFVEPMVRNPSGVVNRELAYSGAAGTGAQIANEIATPGTGEGSALSDIVGSVGGVGGLAGLGAVGGVARNLAAGATNSPRWMDEIAGQAVTDQLVNNSTDMAEQAAPYLARGKDPQLDTSGLAAALRRPAAVEELVPGYQGDVGLRSGDPRLQTFASDVDSRSAGTGNARRRDNNSAVNARVDQMAPQGDPAQFRLQLQQGVDQSISSTLMEEELARLAFEESAGPLAPQMPDPTARGSSIRMGLQGSYDTALSDVEQLYAAIEGDIDPAALAARFGAVDEALPLNDQLRFRPAEADVPRKLLPEEEGVEAKRVPLSEAQAVRSGLSSDMQAARAGGEPRRASVAGKYRDELDRFLEEDLDPETSAAYGEANRARFDVGRRFEEGNTAIAQALKKTGRGEYQLDASALPRRFVQPDTGKISDYQGLMAEAGQDPGVRGAITDQMRADVAPLLNDPAKLERYAQEHGIVLKDFPELRDQLGTAAERRRTLAGAETEHAETEQRLTTPGRSPEASYLRYSNDRVRDSVRQIVNDPDPRKAARQVLETAGDDPATRADLRSAFWEEVKGRGANSATDISGQDVWNARKVREMLDDPKTGAVMEELWADDPEDLASIREVFTALEAATPGRARAPGSSGTAQAVTGKLDPSLTTTSIASRARSVKRGQLSPTIAIVDLLSTWMRNKSTKVQSRAIDQLTAQVVSNPGLAAALLDEYNPATYAAKRRMLTEAFGLRAGSALQLIDNAAAEYEAGSDDEDLERAVDGDR